MRRRPLGGGQGAVVGGQEGNPDIPFPIAYIPTLLWIYYYLLYSTVDIGSVVSI